MACNMRCGHCGSHCTERLPDELNTHEALRLCDELAALGLGRLTLSGGEPFLRKDWPDIAARLNEGGIVVNAISNGWLLDERLVDRAKEAGLANIAMSLDGTQETHDSIRKPGSFNKVMAALDVMQKKEFPSAIVTTVMKKNLAELPEMRNILRNRGVTVWQLQLGLPMGNLHRKDVLDPSQVENVIDFAAPLLDDGALTAYLADSLGYCTRDTVRLSQAHFGESSGWNGCHAGKKNIGILHNGDILGCASIRDPEFVEGNIRETPLSEIWNRPGAFAWNRDRTANDLTGFCASCRHGEYCMAGCANVRLTMTGGMTDNPYCAYRTGIERLTRKIENIHDIDTLIERARKAETIDLHEISAKCLSKVLELEPENLTALKMAGYAWFILGNYTRCLEVNEKALSLAPDDAYALKGLGNALGKLGRIEEGINALRRSIVAAPADFTDPYQDLAVLFLEHKRASQAVEVLQEARKHSADFRKTSEELYQECLAARR